MTSSFHLTCVKVAALVAVVPLTLAACSSSGGAAKTSGPASANSGTAGSGSASASSSGATGSSSATAAASAKLALAYKGTSQNPPSTAPKSPGPENVWVISCGQEAEGCSKPVAGAVAAAKALGWKATVFDGNFGAADAFNTGVRQAIAAKASAILLIGVDCNQAKAGFTDAKAAKIPVIAANSFDCNDPHLKAGPALFSGVVEFASTTPSSADLNAAVGAAKADWLIVATGGKAKTIEVGLNGLTGYYYQNAGFEKEFATCSGCSIVDKVTGNPPDLSNGVLKQSFATALTAHPDANTVFSPGDSLVTGLSIPQALATAGRSSSVKVIGSEGFEQNLALIRSGKGQNAAMPFDETWVGWGLVDETLRVLNKQPVVPEGIGYQALDATHNMPAAGSSYSDPINFVAAYKKTWGVS